MQKDLPHDELLFDLLKKEGESVIHLPYTDKFERVYARYTLSTGTTPQKHEVWEKLLVVEGMATQFSEPQQTIRTASPIAPATATSRPIALPAPQAVSPRTLFDQHFAEADQQAVLARQPWFAPPSLVIEEPLDERAEKLKAAIANSELGSIEQKVGYLLHNFPETRDSDIQLSIRYWRRFQADVLEKWSPLELEVLFELVRQETIGRARRFLQNDLDMYRGIEDTAGNRAIYQKQFYEYLAIHKNSAPEIRLYLDETGNEQDRAYAGVGGICVVNWKQFDKHHAAMLQWRRRENWPATIHFSETGKDQVDRAIRLLGQLAQRRAGLLFVGYAVGSRGRTHQDILSLFVQLTVDTMRAIDSHKCLSQPRVLRIIKEADPGFDGIYLEKLNAQLAEFIAMEFPGRLALVEVEPVEKGRSVLLECADLIAGSMQRRAARKGTDPKDKLSEASFNLTGFNDATDTGALFKYFPA